MIKKLASIVFLLFVIGCATTPNLKQLNSLQPGITKTELVQRFGEPEGTCYVDNCYMLSYFVYNPKGWTHAEYYFIFDKTNRLTGWKEKRQSKTSMTGLVIQPSFPSR